MLGYVKIIGMFERRNFLKQPKFGVDIGKF